MAPGVTDEPRRRERDRNRSTSSSFSPISIDCWVRRPIATSAARYDRIASMTDVDRASSSAYQYDAVCSGMVLIPRFSRAHDASARRGPHLDESARTRYAPPPSPTT
ncbi:hypothetical protein [Microbacterium aurum]